MQRLGISGWRLSWLLARTIRQFVERHSAALQTILPLRFWKKARRDMTTWWIFGAWVSSCELSFRLVEDEESNRGRFAMLTSKPPFQSSTTDEIYRRARERDYEW